MKNCKMNVLESYISQIRKFQNWYQERYANLKYKYGNRHFWCNGYYVIQ